MGYYSYQAINNTLLDFLYNKFEKGKIAPKEQ